MLSWVQVRRVLLSPSVLSVLLIVGLWNLITSSETLAHVIEGPGFIRETLADVRDLNVKLQLRMYQLLFALLPHGARSAKWVTLIFVDDEAHWVTLHGNTPTDRAYLARLIRNASRDNTKAATIGLDVELLSPIGVAGVDDESRESQNRDLLNAIKEAAAKGVRVVLASAYGSQQDGAKVRLAGLFEDASLPAAVSSGCAMTGYINAPRDRREIPLVESVYESGNKGPLPLCSFALATVDADEGGRGTTRKDQLVADAIRDHTPLLGTFIAEAAFEPIIKADDLYAGKPEAVKYCANRIVLIGGKWHELPGASGGSGYGRVVDTHLSPVGIIPGLLFHANYVESLKSGSFRPMVPAYWGIILDLIIGVGIYLGFELLKGWRKVLGLLLALLLVPILAYIFFVNLNLYLDFLLPIEAYFLHLTYELVGGLGATRGQGGET